MGRNRPGNPLGQHAPSFLTPAINSHAIFHGNNELVPPAVAPQRSYLFGGTMPQAHHGQNPLFQQGGGAGPIHSSSVVPPQPHGNGFAALVAGLNNDMPSQMFQPSGHVIGWPLAQMYDTQETQQQEVPRYRGPEPIGPSGRGASAWGQLPLPTPALDARFIQQLTGAVAPPYGSSNSGAPPVGPNRYGATSWAQCTAGPAYLAGSGLASSARTRVLSKPTKSFEEFLRDQGIPVPIVGDELPVLDNTADAFEAMVTELLGDQAVELGLVESVDLVIRAGRNGPLAPAVGSGSCGPTRDQLGIGMVPVPAEPLFATDAMSGGLRYGRAAATAAAREQRSKKHAAKKVAAAAKARAKEDSRYGSKTTLTISNSHNVNINLHFKFN
jgi:hypothetical protein